MQLPSIMVFSALFGKMASNQGPATPQNNTTGAAEKELVHQNRLQEIVSPTEDPGFDIVAIHGLGGDSIKSWTHPETNYMWLVDCLPQEFPNARIFTYGYSGIPTIDDESSRLLARLQGKLRDKPNHPVVFICHSMGGILLKSAMVQANNEQNKYGFFLQQPKMVVFIATPHRGSYITNPKVLELLINSKVGLEKHGVDLEAHCKYLEKLAEQFEERKKDFADGMTLFENKECPGLECVIVEKHSAVIPSVTWRPFSITADHSSICKFKSGPESDDELELVIGELRRMVDDWMKQKQPPPASAPSAPRQQQDIPGFYGCRTPLEEPSLPLLSHGSGISPRGITDRFGPDTWDPKGSAVSVSSYYTPSSQFSSLSVERAGDRTSPSTTPPQSFDVSRYTKAMADARKEFVDKKYRTSYRIYQNLHDELHNHPSGGSYAGDQMSVLVYTASLGMARVCVKLYVLEEEGRVNCDDAVELEKITAFQKDDVNNAVKLLDTLRREGFPKLSQLDLAASDLGRGLCGEAREFAKDVRSLDSYREELKRLLELAMEVKVFFEGRMDVVVR